MADHPLPIEVDARFPSGEWVGFYVQKTAVGERHSMALVLTFRGGRLVGEGRDGVGEFDVRGRYEVKSGEVTFTKGYVARHAVQYRGWNEGKGIWGTWEILRAGLKGGFHIWPKGMRGPRGTLAVEEEVPRGEGEREVMGASGVISN